MAKCSGGGGGSSRSSGSGAASNGSADGSGNGSGVRSGTGSGSGAGSGSAAAGAWLAGPVLPGRGGPTKAPLAVAVRIHWGGTRRTGGSGAFILA
ncbi:hypothetical protein CDA63_11170 [Hymenobacter amundsenii]|uniref:Uncharacterized protein n=1 Tax=Hymenobacter amundsenii TaxID=2006685 RepID=A0A246FKJ0_9BACT|nr:hypothetical protein CDA63_11170 [Hymenobacter amundsenii]